MSLVFLDTETTGLDPEKHEIWEVAYAVDDEPVVSGFVHHKPPVLTYDTLGALRVNGYLDRYGAYALRPFSEDGIEPLLNEYDLKDALRGATLVASNPSFDSAFLRHRWGSAPWHHRMIDISAYAMGALGHPKPAGLYKIAEELDIVTPDHTARQDVITLRECFYALQDFYRENLG